jgi:hypothetical protein
MSTIPKALVHVNTSFAVEPTEEQLLEFYKDYGFETIDDILEGHGGGDWDEVIREWFVNTYYGQDYRELCEKKNILRYESDNQEDEVEILDNEEWDELKSNDLIF